MRASAGRPPWANTLLTLIVVCAPACSHHVQEAQPLSTDWGSIDAGIRSLSWSIGNFPLWTSGLALELAALQLDSLTALLESANSQSAPNPEREWRLGELYRMAHNLDISDAWAASAFHLKRALTSDSLSTMAHFTLGLLYYGTDYQCWTSAERHLQIVLRHPIDSLAQSFGVEPRALFVLFGIYGGSGADSAALATAKILLANGQTDSRTRRIVREFVSDSGHWTWTLNTTGGFPSERCAE